jgi:hypothetical protein
MDQTRSSSSKSLDSISTNQECESLKYNDSEYIEELIALKLAQDQGFNLIKLRIEKYTLMLSQWDASDQVLE